MTLYEAIAAVITALDTKFNYVRAAIFGIGNVTWIKKEGTPQAGDGVNGNYCIDITNMLVYGPKAAGAWPNDPIPPAGLLYGSGTPSNSLGMNKQFYIDITTPAIYGPKIAGDWGTALDFGSGGGGGGGSVLTTKGDLLVFDTEVNRLPVGTDGQVLTADSNEASGVKWDVALKDLPIDTKGDLLSINTDLEFAKLAIGNDGEFLSADSTKVSGLNWKPVAVPRIYTVNESNTGTVPKLIGSIPLPAGLYTNLKAAVGSNDTGYDGILRLKKSDGTILVSALHKGAVSWAVGTGNFTLDTDTYVDVTLEADNATVTAFVKGWEITQ